MEWHEAAKMIRDHKGHAFEFEAVVHLDALLTEIQVNANDDTVSDPADHVTQPVESALMARQVAREIRNLTDYRFMYVYPSDFLLYVLMFHGTDISTTVTVTPDPEHLFSSVPSSKGRRRRKGL